MATISKGITLGYKNGSSSSFVDLTNLQEMKIVLSWQCLEYFPV